MKILMVCLGNICRSPLAEGIMKQKIKQHGLNWTVDSAGTGAYHVGELPDPRSIAEAKRHNIDITDQSARQFTRSDFEEYDLILAMDHSNFRNIINMAPDEKSKEKVKMIMSYATNESRIDVPDPYWDDNGFSLVYKMLDKVIDDIVEKYNEMS
ncbi:MAG: low molecular weight protein-tyrosine-phosphatase [Bacteroidota bacterium]